MKKFLLGLGFSVLSTSIYAVDTLPKEVTDNLYFKGSVYVNEYKEPSNTNATSGTTTAEIQGTGSVIVGSVKNNGFPRLMILGGTTISNKRTFISSETKKWWDGLIEIPSESRTPAASSISFENAAAHKEGNIKIIAGYRMGSDTGDEKFTFSKPVYFVFPVSATDGVRVYVAQEENDKWKIEDENFCIVKDQKCTVALSEIAKITLVQEYFSKCPDTRVQNGTRGSVPNCVVTCNSGYVLNDSGTSCVENEEGEGDFKIDNLQDDDVSSSTKRTTSGYVTYRGSREQLETVDNLDAFDDAAKKRMQLKNAAVKSRVGDTTENEPVKEEDSFSDYLTKLRNTLWEQKNGGFESELNDDESQSENAIDSENDELQNVSENESKALQSESGPLLPRTGAGSLLSLILIGSIVFFFVMKRRSF